jgi:hypothetical protein
MYIGTSLGGCLQSLMAGEVSIHDVLLIVTRTRAPTFEKYIGVVSSYITRSYITYGNPSSRNSHLYDLSHYPNDAVIDMATNLWYMGKIHQPRVGVSDTGNDMSGYSHIDLAGNLWIEIIPPQKMQNPTVKDLWDKIKMTVMLTDEKY